MDGEEDEGGRGDESAVDGGMRGVLDTATEDDDWEMI